MTHISINSNITAEAVLPPFSLPRLKSALEICWRIVTINLMARVMHVAKTKSVKV